MTDRTASDNQLPTSSFQNFDNFPSLFSTLINKQCASFTRNYVPSSMIKMVNICRLNTKQELEQNVQPLEAYTGKIQTTLLHVNVQIA